MDLASTLQRAWAGRGVLSCALWPLGAVVGAIARRRREQARRRPPTPLAVPVVVVGNVLVGGVGKTPITLALVEALRDDGWHPGIVSRGYGRRADGVHEVQPHDDAAATGDEPLLLRRRAGVPVVVAADRVAAAQALLATHPGVDLILSDDGLQHHALPRDLQVVVFDERGAGNGWCLPAGPLREPMPVTPWPGTLVLYNAAHATTAWPGWPVVRRLREAVPLADWWAGRQDNVRPLASLRGEARLAVAGVARPERFFAALKAAGLDLATRALPDHDAFATLPWSDEVPGVLITEKDAVKLAPERVAAGRTQVWVVPLDVQLPEPLRAGLRSALATHRPRGGTGRAG